VVRRDRPRLGFATVSLSSGDPEPRERPTSPTPSTRVAGRRQKRLFSTSCNASVASAAKNVAISDATAAVRGSPMAISFGRMRRIRRSRNQESRTDLVT
jgi:hypothetical protein